MRDTGNKVYLGEDKAFVKNNKTGQSETSVESATCVDAGLVGEETS